MKISRLFVSIALFCFAFSVASASPKDKEPKKVKAQSTIKVTNVYAFGFAYNFSDSTAYISDIQQLSNVSVDKKSGALAHLSTYSKQMSDYLKSTNEAMLPITGVFYYPTLKSAEKESVKLRQRYVNRGFKLTPVDASKFKFSNN